jgi:hypothetical protein
VAEHWLEMMGFLTMSCQSMFVVFVQERVLVCTRVRGKKKSTKELMKTGCWHCVCARAILRGILKAHENRMLALCVRACNTAKHS